MNFYPATAIQVPTKRESTASSERRVVGACGDAAAGGAPGGVGPSNRNIRRNSSSSSLNVAANIFSSMRELQASGRNVSSLGTLSALSQVGIRGAPLPASSALESALGGGMGSSGGMVMGAGGATVGLHSSLNGLMGVGGHAHTESLVAAQRDRLNALAAALESTTPPRSFAATGRSNGTTPLPMEDMLYNDNQMAAGGGDGRSAYSTASIQAQAQALRQLEMEEIMRQHQNQNQNQNAATSNNHYHEQNQQRINLLGNFKGGYAPMHSSTPRCGSDNISGAFSSSHSRSVLENFTPAELLQEVSRRQSQRRSSRDMLTGTEGGGTMASSDPRSPSSVSLMEALSRNNSRDDLVDLYNQMRHRGSSTSTGLRANSLATSLDSFSSLALMARQREGGALSGISAAASTIPHHRAQHWDGGAMPALSLPPRRLSETNNDASSSDASDDQQQRQQRRGSYSKNESSDVVSVPTAKILSSSKSTRDKTTSEESSSDATNSTVVTDTQSPRPSAVASATAIDGSRENKKLSGRKRSNSNASFDALLSVFGDELAKLDREKNGGSKTNSKNGRMEDDDKSADSIVSGASVGFFNKLIEKTAAATVARQNEEEEKNDAMIMKENAAGQDKRRLSSSSSLSDYPRLSHADESRDSSSISQEHPPVAMNNDRVLSHMDNLLDRERQRTIALPPSRDLSSFLPTTSFSNNATSPGTSNYTRKIQSTTSMMASLEAMRHKELVMRERALRSAALRDIQAQRTALGPPPPRDPEMGRLSALLGRRLPGHMGSTGLAGPSSPVQHSEAAAANAMLARLQGFLPEGLPISGLPHNQQVAPPVPNVPTIIEKPPTTTDPNHVHPKVALQQFLDKYGEAADKSCTGMLGAIAETEESLVAIHAWDRSQGLRKCHSRTVVKTRRSRAKVKAFLMGVDPPKEPQKKRKKKKVVAKRVYLIC